MRASNPSSPWTQADDLYVRDHYGKLTVRMMSEDLCRSESAVRSRITRLRSAGGAPPRVPTMDREAVRDTVLNALANAIHRRQLTAEQAMIIGRRLKVTLDYPNAFFKSRQDWTVKQWLGELGA